MTNKEVKELIRLKNLPQWKVAEKTGISEMTLYRWLRTELSPEHFRKIMDAINELSKEGESNDEINC